MTLLATTTIVGIIVTIAIMAVTVSVCLYLYSLKNKDSAEEKDDSDPAE